MNCAFCRIDPDLVVLVPVKENGRTTSSFSCLDCAVKKGVYCEKHDRPHTGFHGDDSTACLSCIEEEVQATEEDRTEEIYSLIRGVLKPDELEDLEDAIEMSSACTGNGDSVSLFRFIVTRAKRLHLSPDEIVVQVLEKRSAAIILPASLF